VIAGCLTRTVTIGGHCAGDLIAGATRAWVQIEERAGERFVLVRDDGVGFEQTEEGGGQSLRNMRERAASIGGTLTLRSTPGSGTALEIALRT
jgi:signal transduction histidine kinase